MTTNQQLKGDDQSSHEHHWVKGKFHPFCIVKDCMAAQVGNKVEILNHVDWIENGE